MVLNSVSDYKNANLGFYINYENYQMVAMHIYTLFPS